MYGDFEAQRHWMEVTIHLPVGDWYRNTPENNLLYWGLDYPPITAYVSWIFGKLFQFVYPPLVAWEASRGHESAQGKSLMRISVILMDIIVFLPAVLMVYMLMKKGSEKRKDTNNLMLWIQLLTIMTAPGMILIDHGHFQYNGVCIGLSLAAFGCVVKGHDLLGSIFFCLSLNFKQMALYYALNIFVILLRKCFIEKTFSLQLQKLFWIGLTVVITFIIIWAPFCVYPSQGETCLTSAAHVFTRLFPFSRGIFEDKVANLWYSFSRIIDFRRFLDVSHLAKLSFVLTLTLLSPILHHLATTDTNNIERILLSLFCSALVFFLASFQVWSKVSVKRQLF